MTLEQAVLAGSVIVATFAGLACLFAVWQRSPWIVLPHQRCRAVPWGSGFCLFAFVLLWILPALVAEPFVPKGTPADIRMSHRLLVSLICLPVLVVTLVVTMRRVFGTLSPWGSFAFRAIRRDVALGCAAWLIATPVVFAIQAAVRVLATWLEAPQAENTLIELLKQQPSVWMWVLVTIEAIMLAPIREELFFRGCVQPWLTNRRWGGDLAVGLALVTPAVFAGENTGVAQIVACSSFVAVAAALSWALTRGHKSQNRYRAIIGTSLLFAVFHASSWPDPVPLFALSLVLGWLGWRTQGVIAPMVCHALFNATSIIYLRLIQPGV